MRKEGFDNLTLTAYVEGQKKAAGYLPDAIV